MKKNVLKVGTRGSQLSLIQTQDALDKLAALFPELAFEVVPFTTVGDRDLKTDLRDSPADFFTRELDDAVREGRVDFAVHSAKDLPDPVPEGLDWFWLPWREDPRDAWILPKGMRNEELGIRNQGDVTESIPHSSFLIPNSRIRVGISSVRREAYCRKRFPNAVMKPVRGAIPDRLAQLDAGDFDAILMAGAALNRLGLAGRVTEWVPLDALPVPPGQGYLAVTFRQGAPLMTRLRSYFVKAVRFVGGGGGGAAYCTLGGGDGPRVAGG
ncbi:MAG: hydroxymethylbilane synthase, partial [Kiritimatiellaeota bacterium]|nr:hydroxymethylbilane synthase [Kiritimatiellota bacterium]